MYIIKAFAPTDKKKFKRTLECLGRYLAHRMSSINHSLKRKKYLGLIRFQNFKYSTLDIQEFYARRTTQDITC